MAQPSSFKFECLARSFENYGAMARKQRKKKAKLKFLWLSLRQTATIHHSRSQTCYFTLFYVLTFGNMENVFFSLFARVSCPLFSAMSDISLRILGVL